MPKSILVAVLLVVAPLASANEQIMEAFRSTIGSWEGELYYLDYQSGQRFGIPMRAEVEATPDGATLIRNLTWTDPGNLVYAVVLSTIDRDTGELVEAYFRNGKAEYLRYDMARANIESATKWKIEFEQDGTDANRPARIRITTERDGNRLTGKKSVRFLDEDSEQFFERNGSDLRLVEVAEQ
ncbi:MAG: hypothetical protein QNI96_07095 [Woeseiaceae bacterium]|nr:hypothetical protein [Woeseiaceae bacterium]